MNRLSFLNSLICNSVPLNNLTSFIQIFYFQQYFRCLTQQAPKFLTLANINVLWLFKFSETFSYFCKLNILKYLSTKNQKFKHIFNDNLKATVSYCNMPIMCKYFKCFTIWTNEYKNCPWLQQKVLMTVGIISYAL